MEGDDRSSDRPPYWPPPAGGTPAGGDPRAPRAVEPGPAPAGPPQGYWAQQWTPPNNDWAVASLVLGIANFIAIPLVGAILALVFGYKAKGEIDRSEGRQGGRGLAVAGIVLGWIGVAVAILAIIGIVLLIGAFSSGAIDIDVPSPTPFPTP